MQQNRRGGGSGWFGWVIFLFLIFGTRFLPPVANWLSQVTGLSITPPPHYRRRGRSWRRDQHRQLDPSDGEPEPQRRRYAAAHRHVALVASAADEPAAQ